jgi:ATP-binding protein involved in chromosome partitioning
MNVEHIKSLLSQLLVTDVDESSGKATNVLSHVINVHTDDTQILILLDAKGLAINKQASIKESIINTLKTNKTIHISFSMDAKPTQQKTPHAAKNPMHKKSISCVKKIIVVSSGKGGVGKSTTAFNLAIAFHKKGLRVAILDADIYGPSLPLMVDCRDKPEVSDDKKLIPIIKYGLSMMSMGFLIDEGMPMIWRGPMVQGALHQLLFEVAWGHRGDIDLLVIDTPPGTGDVHLTLAQQLIIDGAIIVSTPQDMALIDAKKAIAMFDKVSIPVLGLIENMAFFCCPNCGVNTNIFSQGGVHRAAQTANITFLGAIPLNPTIRIACDEGIPLATVQDVQIYETIAQLIVKRLQEN